jgi:hypothetical protein
MKEALRPMASIGEVCDAVRVVVLGGYRRVPDEPCGGDQAGGADDMDDTSVLLRP